jgi:hypothetical protein
MGDVESHEGILLQQQDGGSLGVDLRDDLEDPFGEDGGKALAVCRLVISSSRALWA